MKAASQAREPRRLLSTWSRFSQAAVISIAVAVLVWVMSFLGVSPERGDIALHVVEGGGSGVHVVMPDAKRLGVRLPVGDIDVGLRFRLPAQARDEEYVLFADHILTDRIQLVNPAGRVVGTGSSFHPRGKRAGGASPFYVFPLRGGLAGAEAIYRLRADIALEQTVVLRILPATQLRPLEQRLAIAHAVRYGALLAMVVLLFALHLSTGEPASLAYVGVGLLTLLSLLQLHSYLYLLPGMDRLGDLGIPAILAVRSLLVVSGIHLFLWLGQRDAPPPRLKRWVNRFCLVLVVLIVLQALHWMPHALIAPLGWLYLLGSLLMLGLAWRAIRNGVPLARSIFITMLATILAVFATDLYDMGLIQGGWWVNSGGTGMLIVWLGLMAVSLIRRTSDYRRQLEDAARRQQQLQRAADTDVLTGLPNRAHLDAHLHGGAGAGRAFTVLFIDIDHFKAINDTHGHAAGDAVLRAVAAELARSVRDVDYVARYGGEEFVVVAYGHPIEVTPLAERIRERIAALSIEWQGQVLPVTVSIGVAPTSAPGEAMDRVLARADAAMYAAKRNGRNRVETAAAPDAFYSAAIPQT